MIKLKGQTTVVIGVIILLMLVPLSPLFAAGTPAETPQAGSVPPVPAGMPAQAALNSTGYFLANLIEQTSQFRVLAGETSFSIRPYQSFGYEWGETIPSEEIITFFSPNELATIEVSVITAPALGTTSVNESQIAYIHEWPAVNSTSTVSLLLDLRLNLNGTSSPNIAPSFAPIIVSMDRGNSTGNEYFG